MNTMLNQEVIIVGGGPAGAACAWRLKQKGINCLILDKSKFPRTKPCAGWLTPAVFNLLDIQADQYPYDLTYFDSFKISICGFKFRLPTHQFAIRRLEFDNWLLEKANADVIHQHVRKIEKTKLGYCIDGMFTAKFLIGAGGTHCPVRQNLFKRNPAQRLVGLILAKEEEFFYPTSEKDTHLWFFENGLPGYAWYVNKKNGFINVGIGASAAGLKAKGRTLNDYWEKFIAKLADSGMVKDHNYQPLGHSYYLRQHILEGRAGNAFLIGDALGLATRDMGEGIAAAIKSGLLAADAIIYDSEYHPRSIPSLSFPSLLRLRA
jgi:flavin-dependent dehydrogenase